MSNTQITARKARNLVKRFLEAKGIAYDRLKAKTVDFTDLARASAVFVYIHDVALEHHESLKRLGQEYDFIAKPIVPGANCY